MVKRTVEIAGIDHVGIGTDRSHGFTDRDRDWMRKGRWTRGVDYGAGSAARPGKVPPPDWFGNVRDLAKITDGLKRAGFNQTEDGQDHPRQLAAPVSRRLRRMSGIVRHPEIRRQPR